MAASERGGFLKKREVSLECHCYVPQQRWAKLPEKGILDEEFR